MKNFNSKASTVSLRQNRMEEDSRPNPKIHERGDKVVVNGAKESLLSILKRYECDCRKHTGDKLVLKFLQANRITASYDVIVWMFIFMRLNCVDDLYMLIANEYLKKMEKKNEEVQNHQSEKYKITKKKTLQKFIESAELIMNDSLSWKTIDRSIEALYSKGKSKDNALKKIESYLEKISFEQNLQFIQSCCSLRFRDQKQKIQTLKLTQKNKCQQEKTIQMASDNSEDKIYQNAYSLQENTYEKGEMLEDYESMSYWCGSSKETYDLFEELIQNKDLDGLRGSY